MKKRIMAALTCLCLLLTLLPTTAFVAVDDKFTYEDVTYKVLSEPSDGTQGTVELLGVNNKEITSYTAPDAVSNGDKAYTVTSVGVYALHHA